MKFSSQYRLAAFGVLGGAVVFSLVATAQAPSAAHGSLHGAAPASRAFYPAPVNLHVLPKDLTGKQVHDLMQQWSSELGVRCIACHETETAGIASDATARSSFARDTKQMKKIARLMYTMTDQINVNFVAKVEGSGLPVTCGTCHRGSISPNPYVMPTMPQQTPLPPQAAPNASPVR